MLKIIRVRNASFSNNSAYQLLLARNRTTLTEVKNIAYGSKIQWRGKSYAAPVPSDMLKSRRGWRIPKVERRAIVESFVNKYGATHGGKFPSATDTQKHIGGSYYVIRVIIQELEFKSKMAPSDREAENLLEVGLIKESKVTVDVEAQNDANTLTAKDVEAQNDDANTLTAKDVEAQNDANAITAKDVETQNDANTITSKDVEIDDTNNNHVEAEKESLAFGVAERTLFEEVAKPVASGGQSDIEGGKKVEAEGVPSYFVATESHSLGETEKVFHGQFNNVNEREEQILSQNLPHSGGIKHEDGQNKGSSEPKRNAIDTSSSLPNEAENPKKSSIWGSLKSFADGFMRMWRDM